MVCMTWYLLVCVIYTLSKEGTITGFLKFFFCSWFLLPFLVYDTSPFFFVLFSCFKDIHISRLQKNECVRRMGEIKKSIPVWIALLMGVLSESPVPCLLCWCCYSVVNDKSCLLGIIKCYVTFLSMHFVYVFRFILLTHLKLIF